jgi:hypothetical protein
MSQEYYVNNLLPNHIDAIVKRHEDDARNGLYRRPWLLQEDGDPSHGKKSLGPCYWLKQRDWIDELYHPAQSPDLNPIEAIWNIIKNRIRRRVWHTLDEFKALLEEEWNKITLEEIRERILDMPRRCRLLVKTGGKSIKGAKW